MNKNGYNTSGYGMNPFPTEERDRIIEAEFEWVYHEVAEDLKRQGFCENYGVSMLDVFDNIVLTGLKDHPRDAMTSALHTLYKHRPSLRKLIENDIDYIARITAEHATS